MLKKYSGSTVFLAALLSCGVEGTVHSQEAVRNEQSTDEAALAERETDETAAGVLPPEEWERVDAAVNRALTWLAAMQQPDGSFPTLDMGQPGVTSLCVMSFMAHGHLPGEGQYGERLERAVDYVLDSQSENGLLSRVGAQGATINRNVPHEIGEAAAYNHAIASLMLSEFYGMSQSERSDRVQKVIAAALAASLQMQRWPKNPATDRGGWRYIGRPVYGTDSDLSVTGWELMFLRSARNAGFNVPKESIDEAVAYIRRCFHDNYGTFLYMQGKGNQDLRSRAMAGAGILALAHAGAHNTPEAKRSADWLLQYDFEKYNEIEQYTQSWPIDRYHYSLFNSCQGLYQIGGQHWERFFPRTVRTLLANQQPDGSWQAERHQNDAKFGSAYTTALVVLSLGAPNQFLPVFQR
jgi:hypothetical protein